MNARQIRDRFHSLVPEVDPEKTVDQIIAGDPEKRVRKIVVTWISSFDALRAAVDHGYDMLITHEPTFWNHMGDVEKLRETEIGRKKHDFIEDSGLVVLRVHDVWDRMPRIGIPWAWAQFLDLGDDPAAVAYGNMLHRYDIKPMKFGDFTRKVAARRFRPPHSGL